MTLVFCNGIPGVAVGSGADSGAEIVVVFREARNYSASNGTLTYCM